MGSDAIANSRLSAFARDSVKKKKGSRLGKVKQNKVDVRRQQWVSQVRNKGCKMEADALPSTIPKPIDGCRARANLPMRTREEDDHEPTTLSWPNKRMDRSQYLSGKDLTGRTSRNSCSSFSNSGGEREYHEGCLDNWEAIEDALPSLNNSKKQTSESDLESFCSSDHRCSKSVHLEDAGKSQGFGGNTRAWAPDDTFRPQSLPRISTKQQQKQKKKPLTQNSKHWRPTRLPWQHAVVLEEVSACPICCEELDITDSNFLPCPCGFRLCLFCHKRILEVDARCPGCRKQYDSVHAGAGFDSEPVVACSWSVKHKRF